MSGRGDDKSIEPAHQPSVGKISACNLPGPPWEWTAPVYVPSPIHIGEILTEDRVRRVAAEIVVAAEKRLGDALAAIGRRLERVEAEAERLALRLSDAEDQWRRTRARHEAMFRRVEALETTAREIALAGSIGDEDFARRTSDDILAKMDAPRNDTAAVQAALDKGWMVVPGGAVQCPLHERGLTADEHDILDKALDRSVRIVAKGHKEPPRPTGWAVVTDFCGDQLPKVLEVMQYGTVALTTIGQARPAYIRWLGSRADAETLARLLGVGRPARLYRDTLEEVG